MLSSVGLPAFIWEMMLSLIYPEVFIACYPSFCASVWFFILTTSHHYLVGFLFGPQDSSILAQTCVHHRSVWGIPCESQHDYTHRTHFIWLLPD